MREAVSDILRERAREDEGFGRVFGYSLVAHVVLLVLVVLAPAQWRAGSRAAAPRDVMFISLGGAPGPASGGMTPIGGRPIQQALPAPEGRRPEPVRPPAPKLPEMTVPAEKPRLSRLPARVPAEAPRASRGRTATSGPETRPGSATAETGAQGTGFGLTTGGGGGTGSYLDVGDFCCPDYLNTMIGVIRRNWDENQPVPGSALVKFTIQRDGMLTDVEIERSSGYFMLDTAAHRALLLTRKLPPLPAAFTEPTLTVHLSFEYKRRP